jgi:dienelactone hydrolase
MSIVIFIILGVAELVFLIGRLWNKKLYQKEKSIVNLFEFLLFIILVISKVIEFGFQWQVLLIILAVRAIIAVIILLRKESKKEYRVRKVLVQSIFHFILIGIGILPTLIFPDNNPFLPSGPYEIKTASFTWEDKDRLETFKSDGSNRKITVQFWYPDTQTNETFPLVVFSHGAFGYRMSNYSTYEELVSNGYVVCSIEHTYHAFYTKQTDGKVITVNPEFMKDVFKINEDGISEDEIFTITREWMTIRSDDMNFVLDTIKDKTITEKDSTIFSKIDISQIGVMGHSLGGATAVGIGRQRDDIGAVISLDATMLSEELDCVNNVYTINEEPYKTPLLCIDTTNHYEQGSAYGDLYVNNVVLKNAKDAREIHFNETEHLNFTDLPLFSPFLASLLGTGEVDPVSCIQTMNEVILNYYNHYLKQKEELNIKESY